MPAFSLVGFEQYLAALAAKYSKKMLVLARQGPYSSILLLCRILVGFRLTNVLQSPAATEPQCLQPGRTA